MADSRPVTAGDVISASVKYSNKDDEGRAYDIAAEVNISGKRVQSITNGYVRTPDGNQTADFNRYDPQGLNLNFYNIPDADKPAVLAAVLAFIAEVNANVEAANAEEPTA